MGETFKLSKQSMAVLMTLLQKCLIEQTDITLLLEELDFEVDAGELFVQNPPVSFKIDSEDA
jgi:hypothetical protein